MRRVAMVAVASVLLLGACHSDHGHHPRASTTTGSGCPAPTPAPTDVHVIGLHVPPGFVALTARPTGKKLIKVTGYVEMTPLEVFAFYRKAKRAKDYEYFLLENEVIEAEAFFTDGEHRNYMTARTACPGRSDMFVFVAPEDYSKSP
jgi:hypothetical protein